MLVYFTQLMRGFSALVMCRTRRLSMLVTLMYLKEKATGVG